MRVFKKILLGILVLLVLAAILGFMYINSLKPQYSGNLELKDLQSEVSTYFDDYGIPHIYAQNEEDAFTTLGYLHAQDRLWQMELIKRIAPGRLSEILGKDLLPTDKFFATLGIEEATEKAINKIDTNSKSYKLAIAYINGVNQFIDEGATPIEFTLVGVKKEHFQLKDMYNTFGYMAFSFAMAQKTDPLLSSLQNKLGEDYLKALNIDINPNTLFIKNAKGDIENYQKMVSNINHIMNTSPIPPFIGSNSWVIGGEKTESGKVIFANDPHIGFSQPSIWFEAHLVTPDHEIYGYFYLLFLSLF